MQSLVELYIIKMHGTGVKSVTLFSMDLILSQMNPLSAYIFNSKFKVALSNNFTWYSLVAYYTILAYPCV